MKLKKSAKISNGARLCAQHQPQHSGMSARCGWVFDHSRAPVHMPSRFCSAIPHNHRAPRGFWIAVAERSGDTAFRLRTELPKRRGASLPAEVQKDLVAASPRCVFAFQFA